MLLGDRCVMKKWSRDPPPAHRLTLSRASLQEKNVRKRGEMGRIFRPWPAEKTQQAGRRVTRAAGACICICGHAIWAEQTHRLTCRAPATCTERRQMSWRWRRSGPLATEPSGPVTKLDPLDHLQPIPAAQTGPMGGSSPEAGRNFRPVGCLIPHEVI
jgi:hypothetical protein